MANNNTVAYGQAVSFAESSLNTLAIGLDDGQVILISAIEDDGEPIANVALVEQSKVPQLNEAVCRVDWSWIVASKVLSLAVEENKVRLQLNPAGLLTVTAAVWQGKPFLGFQPYKPAK